jgi:hypothetical protein
MAETIANDIFSTFIIVKRIVDHTELTKCSINGLPKITVPQIMVSFKINLPEKVAVANLHGLYLAIPNGMYTMSSGMGVSAARKAPSHPSL